MKKTVLFSGCEGQQDQRSDSMCCCRFSLLLLFLLLPAEDDADDVSLVLLHVLHQPLLADGLEAADTAAEKQHAVLCTTDGGTCGARLWLSVTVVQHQ